MESDFTREKISHVGRQTAGGIDNANLPLPGIQNLGPFLISEGFTYLFRSHDGKF